MIFTMLVMETTVMNRMTTANDSDEMFSDGYSNEYSDSIDDGDSGGYQWT